MRTLLAISAIAALTMSSVAFADPSDPEDPEEPSESGCISTYCKGDYKPGEVPTGGVSKEPKPLICMDTIGDGSGPQFDGCVLPGGPVSPGG